VIVVLTKMLPANTGDWTGVMQVIAIITMILGNIIALVQDNI